MTEDTDVLIVPKTFGEDGSLGSLSRAINRLGHTAIRMQAERDDFENKLIAARAIIDKAIGLLLDGKPKSATIELQALSEAMQ